jgi:hypothetical protein
VVNCAGVRQGEVVFGRQASVSGRNLCRLTVGQMDAVETWVYVRAVFGIRDDPVFHLCKFALAQREQPQRGRYDTPHQAHRTAEQPRRESGPTFPLISSWAIRRA